MLQITAGWGGRKSLNLSRKLKVDCFSCFIRWQDSLLEKISVWGRYILYFECWTPNSDNDSSKTNCIYFFANIIIFSFIKEGKISAKMSLKCFSENHLKTKFVMVLYKYKYITVKLLVAPEDTKFRAALSVVSPLQSALYLFSGWLAEIHRGHRGGKNSDS